MEIDILCDQPRFSRGFHDFFPIYRWSAALARKGWSVRTVWDHKLLGRKTADIVIVSNRYFMRLRMSRACIIDYLKWLKERYDKVVWFDAVDTSGIVDFDIIQYVDVLLKKQVLKDKSYYTKNLKDKSVRIWLHNQGLDKKYENYVPCPEDQLYKIRVGWNIGLCDFRSFLGHFGFLRNYVFWDPYVERVNRNRKIDIAYRGTFDYGNSGISFQRNALFTILGELANKHTGLVVAQGGKIGYTKYLAELRNSKLSLSPFGWGEICYRDFESILAGAVLIKPNMDHIETFPNIFSEDCYVQTDWQLSNASTQLLNAVENYHEIQNISRKAQDFYIPHVTGSNLFIEHLCKCLSF